VVQENVFAGAIPINGNLFVFRAGAVR